MHNVEVGSFLNSLTTFPIGAPSQLAELDMFRHSYHHKVRPNSNSKSFRSHPSFPPKSALGIS